MAVQDATSVPVTSSTPMWSKDNPAIDINEIKNVDTFRNMQQRNSEAATRRCFLEKVFWKYAANLQENTHAQKWFQLSCFATLLKSHFGIDVLL